MGPFCKTGPFWIFLEISSHPHQLAILNISTRISGEGHGNFRLMQHATELCEMYQVGLLTLGHDSLRELGVLRRQGQKFLHGFHRSCAV